MLLYVGRHCLHVSRPSAAPTSAAGNCVTTRFAIPGSIGCAARACWVSRPHCEHRLRGLAVARSSSVRARVLWHSHLFEHIARDGQVGTRSHLLGFRRSPRDDPRMTRDWRRGGGEVAVAAAAVAASIPTSHRCSTAPSRSSSCTPRRSKRSPRGRDDARQQRDPS